MIDWKQKGRAVAEEFIRRFLIHVLPTGFHRIRHYGLFASSALLYYAIGLFAQHGAERGLALLAALVAFTPNARLTLMAIALLVAIDAATLLAYLGPFIGEAMLGAAAGLHLVAALSAGKKRQ